MPRWKKDRPSTTRVCRACGKRKKLDKFSPHKNCRWGVRPDCKECRTEWYEGYRKKHAKKRAESARAYRTDNRDMWWKNYIKKKYGIDYHDYDKLLAGQGGGCAICGTKPGTGRRRHLNIDHDHKTKKVRGILCHMCNRGLPFYRDDPKRFRAAAAYLDSTPASRLL